MLELLAELEAICAKYCARRLTEEQRARLVEVHRDSLRHVEANDADGYRQSNADFHAVLYAGCHNIYLAQQLHAIRQRTRMYRQNSFVQPGRMQISFEDHQRIVDAILRGDAEAAQQHMLEHITVGGRGFAEFVSTLPRHMFEPHDIKHARAHEM